VANYNLGEIRRSSVVTTFGPGAIIDFRSDGAPVSAVAAGLEAWDEYFRPQGLMNPQRIAEPRLQRKLGVKGFRLPPVVDEQWRDSNGNPDRRSLVAIRFPIWLQCPQCNRIAPSNKWKSDPGMSSCYCPICTNLTPGRKKVFVVPVRFVMACPSGHLDEFPWHYWVNHKPDCNNQTGFLILKPERPGLAGLILSCPNAKCKARRSMEHIFNSKVWQGFICRGRRPWLTVENEECACQPRVLQRGASNLYFPIFESALSIPPWSDSLQEALGIYWDSLVNVDQAQRADYVKLLAHGELGPVLQEFHLTPDELSKQIENRISLFSGDAILDIRQEEYRQFLSGIDTPKDDAREFEIRNVDVPNNLHHYISRIVKVVRLREVRAIRGFTRINQPGDLSGSNISRLSAGNLDWLPAIEVRGEGIFLAFNMESLIAWETTDYPTERSSEINKRWFEEWKRRFGDSAPDTVITPRLLLIHTFAHALMRQLTLECGYSTAALRERLYVSDKDTGMAGLLLYTATSDSDGTLGGLQRQGNSLRISRLILAAIKAMEWCSSDPLCIQGVLSSYESHSYAACHACVLAPETACEFHNRFLDRSSLIGDPIKPEAGFFKELLREQ